MVIISTSATDVSIHAVSPELGVHFSRILPPQAGGAASSAKAVPPSASQRRAIPNRTNADGTSLRAYVPVCIVDLQVPRDFPSGFSVVDARSDLSSDLVERMRGDAPDLADGADVRHKFPKPRRGADAAGSCHADSGGDEPHGYR